MHIGTVGLPRCLPDLIMQIHETFICAAYVPHDTVPERPLRVNNPTPMELRGSPRLETRIPPSNPRILNTHKNIFIKNKFILFLDVW
jgi:hypothetical protein